MARVSSAKKDTDVCWRQRGNYPKKLCCSKGPFMTAVLGQKIMVFMISCHKFRVGLVLHLEFAATRCWFVLTEKNHKGEHPKVVGSHRDRRIAVVCLCS